MADKTSGTVRATPLGDMWVGSIEIASGSDGDIVGVQEIIGKKIDGIVFATGDSGTCSFSSSSGSVTLSGASTKILFHALSKKE